MTDISAEERREIAALYDINLPTWNTRLNTIFKWLLAYLSIAGLVTFSLFILEESFQTIMFGTWPAQDAGAWEVVVEGTDMMEGVVTTMRVVNYSAGWIQPLAFISYRSYANSAEFYIKGLRAKALAMSPESFVNRNVTISFTPRSLVTIGDQKYLTSGRIHIPTDTDVGWNGGRTARGVLLKHDGKLFLEVHDEKPLP
jgi:hypothetical protein